MIVVIFVILWTDPHSEISSYSHVDIGIEQFWTLSEEYQGKLHSMRKDIILFSWTTFLFVRYNLFVWK